MPSYEQNTIYKVIGTCGRRIMNIYSKKIYISIKKHNQLWKCIKELIPFPLCWSARLKCLKKRFKNVYKLIYPLFPEVSFRMSIKYNGRLKHLLGHTMISRTDCMKLINHGEIILSSMEFQQTLKVKLFWKLNSFEKIIFLSYSLLRITNVLCLPSIISPKNTGLYTREYSKWRSFGWWNVPFLNESFLIQVINDWVVCVCRSFEMVIKC